LFSTTTTQPQSREREREREKDLAAIGRRATQSFFFCKIFYLCYYYYFLLWLPFVVACQIVIQFSTRVPGKTRARDPVVDVHGPFFFFFWMMMITWTCFYFFNRQSNLSLSN
jgi:hypothetical protein